MTRSGIRRLMTVLATGMLMVACAMRPPTLAMLDTHGPYLGQLPPGTVPVIFAPGMG